MNATERLDSEVLAPLARRGAARMRARAYSRVRSNYLLAPTVPAHQVAERRLELGEGRFTPGFYWSGAWTEEARRAYYGLKVAKL
jgi:hypothetical protein